MNLKFPENNKPPQPIGTKKTTKDDSAINEILKRVDQFIKKGDLQLAQNEVSKARELDPRNVYALALEERIINLKKEFERIEKEKQNKVVDVSTSQTKTVEVNLKTRTINDVPKNTEIEIQKPKPQIINNRSITTTNNLQKSKPENQSTSLGRNTQSFSSIQQPEQAKILVIDDEPQFLELVKNLLEMNGFEVVTLQTSDEAYALLKVFTPDLILCDIRLVTSTMDGLTFYKKIQIYKNLKKVPFVFLTGLKDDRLISASKELGIDDFLLKPISQKMLIATIRGKIKRFKQLENNNN